MILDLRLYINIFIFISTEDAKYANYKKLEKFAEEKTEDEVEEVDVRNLFIN